MPPHRSSAGSAASTTMWSRIRSSGVVQLRQPMPGGAAIQRFVEPAVGRAKVEMIGLARNRMQGARVAAGGAHRVPGPAVRRCWAASPAATKMRTRSDQRQNTAPASRSRQILQTPIQTRAPGSRKNERKMAHKTKEADRLAGQPRWIAGGIAWFAFIGPPSSWRREAGHCG